MLCASSVYAVSGLTARRRRVQSARSSRTSSRSPTTQACTHPLSYLHARVMQIDADSACADGMRSGHAVPTAATTSGVQPSSSSSSTPTPSTSTSTPAPSTSTTPPLPTSSSSTSAAPTSSSSSSTPIQTTERARAFPDTSAALASCTLNATWEEVIRSS
eukprot:2515698-Rhodomonas_salina.4